MIYGPSDPLPNAMTLGDYYEEKPAKDYDYYDPADEELWDEE